MGPGGPGGIKEKNEGQLGGSVSQTFLSTSVRRITKHSDQREEHRKCSLTPCHLATPLPRQAYAPTNLQALGCVSIKTEQTKPPAPLVLTLYLEK